MDTGIPGSKTPEHLSARLLLSSASGFDPVAVACFCSYLKPHKGRPTFALPARPSGLLSAPEGQTSISKGAAFSQ